MSPKTWIKAFRLRTLPLAVSSILMGSFVAIFDGTYSGTVIGLAILTTVLLQILSNLANDYGDSQKGTDNVNRLGPERTVQSGAITPAQMKKGIIVFVILSLLSGVSLLYFSFPDDFMLALIFLLIGLAAIWSAIKYTVGKGAYGYAGFGDLFVFLFFGLAGVLGTYYLNARTLNWEVVLPAMSLGFLSMGVLNLNNMRDIDNDVKSGKNTLASRLGFRRAKIYHAVLIISAILLTLDFVLANYESPLNLIFLLAAVIMILDLVKVLKTQEQGRLDPFLKKLALSTFLFTLLFGAGMLV